MTKIPFPNQHRGNGMGDPPPQMGVVPNLPPEAQRTCICGNPYFQPAFIPYEIATGVIGEKNHTLLQVFVCMKCNSLLGEGTIKSVIPPEKVPSQ